MHCRRRAYPIIDDMIYRCRSEGECVFQTMLSASFFRSWEAEDGGIGGAGEGCSDAGLHSTQSSMVKRTRTTTMRVKISIVLEQKVEKHKRM